MEGTRGQIVVVVVVWIVWMVAGSAVTGSRFPFTEAAVTSYGAFATQG